MTDKELAKRLYDLRTEFGRMCLAHDCKDCEMEAFAHEGVCAHAWIWKRLREETCGKQGSCPAAQKEEAAAAAPNESPKAKEGTRLPKWVKEGQWVLMNNTLYKIVDVNGDPYYPLTVKDIHGGNVFAHPRVMCPVRFRPYTFEEAKVLIGKTMEWSYTEGVRCTSLIHKIEENGMGVEINNTQVNHLMTCFNATINGMPLGVPEVDKELLKGGEE